MADANPELLEAGGQIFEYLPAVSHAKALIVDEDLTQAVPRAISTRAISKRLLESAARLLRPLL